MRNLKRVLALAMAMVMILGMMVIGSSAASYSDAAAIDVKYSEAVEVLTGMGVFKGTGAGFAPKAVLTRAEASALIYRVLTGDVTDAQVINYNYSTFDDVAAGQWYTGYITYAANGGYIKGFDGKAMPNDTVTGVQVMAIMLRAAGYGVNGEYEGAGWMDNVLTDAKNLGITGNIATSTLIAPATREVVAQLIFNALTETVMVSYTPALGYLPVTIPGTMTGLADNAFNVMTLGLKVFGLTDEEGIVVGNQATGEAVTKINLDDDYDYAGASNFATATDLSLFGHSVKVWYDYRTLTATAGKSTITYALFDKATNVAVVEGKSNAVAYAAGFDIPVALKNSPATATAAYCNDSYGATYVAGGPASDYPIYVMISNSYDKSLDLVIGVDAKVVQVTDINNYIAKPSVTFTTIGKIDRAQITSGAENVIVGKYVIVNEITGTANTKVANAPYYAVDTVTQTKTGKIMYVANTTVVLADGTKIEQSPLYPYSDMTKAGLVAGVELTFALDNQGKYIGVMTPAAEYLYVTYAYWEQTGLSTINYYLQGVTLDGKVTTVATDRDGYLAAAGAQVSYKEYGNDWVNEGGYALMQITKTATVASWDKVLTDFVITPATYKVDTTTFLGSNTEYHVITGYGDTLKVVPYVGSEALLAGANAVEIDGIYTEASLSTTTTTTYNTIVVDVLVDGAKFTYSGNYLYGGDKALNSMATKIGDPTIQLFNLYVAGEATTTPVWVDTDAGVAPDLNTFYTYTKAYDKTLGTDVYTLTASTSGNPGGRSQIAVSQAKGSALDYVKHATGNQFVATGATVIDLRQGGTISSVAQLNEAAENNNIVVDWLFNAKKEVTLIYVTDVTQK